jgi:DNA (cytosine-5)-methyltransferase 1
VCDEEILRLSKLKSGELDFLIGGPPCQGFSSNGKRWLEDNRNQLMQRFVELARQIRPVHHHRKRADGALGVAKTFNEEIQEAFSGYVVKTSVLNASQFGVPQIRRRAFIVGIRADLGISDFDFPRGALIPSMSGTIRTVKPKPIRASSP